MMTLMRQMRTMRASAAMFVGLLSVSSMVFAPAAEAASPILTAPNFSGYFSGLTWTAASTSFCSYSERGANDCSGVDSGNNYVLPAANGLPDGTAGSMALPCNPFQPPAYDPTTGNINITSVGTFLSMLKDYSVSGDIRKEAGSAFIVHTFLGRSGAAANLQGGRAVTTTDWNDFENRMDGAVSIDWGCGRIARDPFRTFSAYEPATNTADVVYYADNANPQVGPAIVFTGNDGSVYTLFRECANPGGSSSGLPSVDYGITMTATSVPSQGANPPKVGPGSTVNISVNVKNAGPAAGQLADLQIMYPGAFAAVAPCAPNCVPPPPAMFPMSGGYSIANGFRTGSTIAGTNPADDNWFWTVNPLPVGGLGETASVNFTIPANAPVGSFTVDVYFEPSDLSNGQEFMQLIFDVQAIRTPTINALNGDVHAGDCKQDPTQGYVLTDLNSFGQYVVSGSSTINNFRSNNAAPGKDTLKLGSVGGYSRLCRKDLVKVALDGQPTVFNQILTNTFDVTQKEGIWYYLGGGTLSLKGIVGQPISGRTPGALTVVAPNANVRIIEDLVLDNSAYATRSVPSLGILAQGDILIKSNVKQVDAYMFSNGTVYTCDGVGIACSNPGTLRVNGFLMAKDIWFGRLGPLDSSGSPVAETVVLTPQLYLNPPPFFDSGVDGVSLFGQGERPPLY